MGTSNLRKLLEDDRVWTVAARVEVHDGETDHYAVNEEGDVIVSVVTLTHGVPLWANLDALTGGAGAGVWSLPDPGVEVLVAFDGGEFEGEAYIVGRTGGGSAPVGLVPGKVLVIGAAVEIRTADGTASALAFKSELEALRDYVADKMVIVTPSGNSTPGVAPLPSPQPPTPAGSTVLKAQ